MTLKCDDVYPLNVILNLVRGQYAILAGTLHNTLGIFTSSIASLFSLSFYQNDKFFRPRSNREMTE